MDQKISELPLSASVALSTIFATVAQGASITEKSPLQQLVNLIATGGSLTIELFAGAAAPSNADGKPYDIYLRSSGQVYQKTLSNVWSQKGTINASGGSALKVYFNPANPDNSVGNPNDIYIKGGVIYQKDGGAWTVRGTLRDFVQLHVTDALSFAFGSNSIRYKPTTAAGGILHLNIGETYDEADDILRYAIAAQEIQTLWKLVVSSLKFGTIPDEGDVTTDKLLLMKPDGTVRVLNPFVIFPGLQASKTEADLLVDGGGVSYVPLLDNDGNPFPSQVMFYLTYTVDDGHADGPMTQELVGSIFNRTAWDCPRIYNLPAVFQLTILAK